MYQTTQFVTFCIWSLIIPVLISFIIENRGNVAYHPEEWKPFWSCFYLQPEITMSSWRPKKRYCFERFNLLFQLIIGRQIANTDTFYDKISIRCREILKGKLPFNCLLFYKIYRNTLPYLKQFFFFQHPNQV